MGAETELEIDYASLHARARRRGVNRLFFRLAKLVLQPFFLGYFRLSRIGREHIPQSGPVIFAANHRSFLDPFIVGTMSKRPIYYVAKQELFLSPLKGRFLNALGAFPVRRGLADEEMLETARTILARGDSVLIFPEGTRIREGSLSRPKRGVGRLALETGATVVPVALHGTEHVRRGWRIRPRKVRIRAGRPLQFPQTASPSPELAQAVTDRIWPHVGFLWEWLGGFPPLRTVVVVGSGSWGTAVATLLANVGLDVTLGSRTREQADEMDRERRNERYLPGVDLSGELTFKAIPEIEFQIQDLVVFAVPSKELPNAVAQVGDRIGPRSAVLVLSKGLVPPLGTLPSEYVSSRLQARAFACLGGPAHAKEAVLEGAAVVLATKDEAFRRQLGDVLEQAGIEVERSADIVGVELAGCAKNVAALAASAAASAGMNAAGAAAGHSFQEIHRLALSRGCEYETFIGLAGTGDLVATVLAEGSRNRRAGKLLGDGVPAGEIKERLGQVAESVDTVPLMALVLEQAGADAPTVYALRDLISGRIDQHGWIEAIRARDEDAPRPSLHAQAGVR